MALKKSNAFLAELDLRTAQIRKRILEHFKLNSLKERESRSLVNSWRTKVIPKPLNFLENSTKNMSKPQKSAIL